MKKLFDDDELFEWNEDGKVIFTAQYLLQRGYCCGNGCRNCPFEYKNVENLQLRKKLLEAQQKRKVDDKR